MNSQEIPGSRGGNHFLCRLVDQAETYGEHIIKKFLTQISTENQSVQQIIDLGAGAGRDLGFAHKIFPTAKKIGIDIPSNVKKHDFYEKIYLDLEKDPLPFLPESVDVFIANQVLEHTKELFWIFHQVTKSLRVGGYFIIGVPNVAAFHNRLLMLLGRHPTQFKSYSAHVRVFSKHDLLKFVDVCFPFGYQLEGFAGSQFYPFPPSLSKMVCQIFPNTAFSIFFLFKKIKNYDKQFLDHVSRANLETPFFVG